MRNRDEWRQAAAMLADLMGKAVPPDLLTNQQAGYWPKANDAMLAEVDVRGSCIRLYESGVWLTDDPEMTDMLNLRCPYSTWVQPSEPWPPEVAARELAQAMGGRVTYVAAPPEPDGDEQMIY